jgi:hypothetical protein
MPRDASMSPGAVALRRAGFVKLPGWWVHEDDLEIIKYLAEKRLPEINRIKDQAYGETPTSNPSAD